MNRTRNFSLWAAAILAAATFATPAKATLIDVTWTGSVSSGNVGAAGAFGIQDTFGGNELAGQAFTATYRFDTTIGSLVTGAGFADLRGGSQFGDGSLASPVISATLTINGITVSFGSDLFGGYSRKSADGVSDIYTEVNASNPGGAVDILFLREFRFDENIPFTGLDESLTQALGAVGDGVQGVFQQFDDSTGDFLFSGNLVSTLVTINPVVDTPPTDSVPEPASMALLGLGLLGIYAARRRRETTI